MILALDQGTTGSTALVLDDDGRIAGRRTREFTQHFPRPGWVEHDAAEIWRTTLAVAQEALEAAGARGPDLRGIGITNQRETAVAWDRSTGEALTRAIVWQDRRTTERCEQLQAEGRLPLVRERCGLTIDPYFSATKFEWMLQNVDGLRENSNLAFGTVDAWLLYKLTGRHATDYTNASRTMLFDIFARRWDEELCELFGVPPASLPDALPSEGVFALTDRSIFGGAEVPVAGIAGDQQAALFGQACLAPGLAKNTYGTGSFVLLNVGATPPAPAEGLITTIAWGRPGGTDYAYEASVFIAGAAVQWLRDGLGLIANAQETERLAESLESNDGVYFVPALTGLGSPHWDPRARGALMGLTRGTTRAHLARAALEAIAYQTVDAVGAMERAAGITLQELRADGGAVANRWLMQFQADVLGVPVVVPEITETTAFGAGLLAGLATGVWGEGDLSGLYRENARYEPRMSESRRETLIGEWAKTVEATRGRGTPEAADRNDEESDR